MLRGNSTLRMLQFPWRSASQVEQAGVERDDVEGEGGEHRAGVGLNVKHQTLTRLAAFDPGIPFGRGVENRRAINARGSRRSRPGWSFQCDRHEGLRA